MADDMFRAPVHRAMQTLDRSQFTKIIPLKAGRILQNQTIGKVRKELERSRDCLFQNRITAVRPDPDQALAEAGRKCVLLRPEHDAHIQPSRSTENNDVAGSSEQAMKPHSSVVQKLVQEGLLEVIPYDLRLDYDYWTYHEIMSAILPEDELGEIPSGFTQVGHVAHLNIRDEYLKHKYLIAEVLMDKNPIVRTVINKIDDVGEENEYRTFKYEVLAGSDDMNVTISEANCIFKFDYSKVYWNSRLNTEHTRLVDSFKPGEVVCDVMAGIGPFAVPAGKKGVFVWANDLNPDSYVSLKDSIVRNKVQDYVRPFNEDGRTYIQDAAKRLIQAEHKVEIMSKSKRSDTTPPQLLATIEQPKTFQHFVMNLPASALSFLPSFIGLYTDKVFESLPKEAPMPVVHVYCFNTKSDDNAEEKIKICEEISGLLQHKMRLGEINDGGVAIHDVRDVAPKKRMFCASFQLPREVAFRSSS